MFGLLSGGACPMAEKKKSGDGKERKMYVICFKKNVFCVIGNIIFCLFGCIRVVVWMFVLKKFSSKNLLGVGIFVGCVRLGILWVVGVQEKKKKKRKKKKQKKKKRKNFSENLIENI